MDTPIIYLSLSESVLVNRTPVLLGDIATVYCTDNKIKQYVEALELPITFSTNKHQAVITSLKIIEIISNQLETLINSIGATESLIYYQPLGHNKQKKTVILKSIFLFIVAFFGAGYSIMSYNGDVGTKSLLKSIQKLLTNSSDENFLKYGILSYSIGLCLGMIIFFNHGTNKTNAYDPTPLEVQMRSYEQQVNNCITITSDRKKETIDVD